MHTHEILSKKSYRKRNLIIKQINFFAYFDPYLLDCEHNMRVTELDCDALRIAGVRIRTRKWPSLTFRQHPYHFTVVPKSKRPYKDTGVWPLEWLRRSIEKRVGDAFGGGRDENKSSDFPARKRTSCVHACCHARIRVRSWDENRLHVRISCARDRPIRSSFLFPWEVNASLFMRMHNSL